MSWCICVMIGTYVFHLRILIESDVDFQWDSHRLSGAHSGQQIIWVHIQNCLPTVCVILSYLYVPLFILTIVVRYEQTFPHLVQTGVCTRALPLHAALQVYWKTCLGTRQKYIFCEVPFACSVRSVDYMSACDSVLTGPGKLCISHVLNWFCFGLQ